MPEFAEVAQSLTDAAIVHLTAIVPLVAAGAVALTGAVVSSVAWLCYTELRSGRTRRGVTRLSPSPRLSLPLRRRARAR